MQESLKQWYLKFIDYLRKEYEKLPAVEKKNSTISHDFFNPCQIEVFWIADLDYQLIIQSNFNDRPDKEIIINGPYKSYEFCSKVITILKEKRWTRKLKQILPYRYEQFDTLGEKMAKEIHRFIEFSKNSAFTSQNEFREVIGMTVDDTWTFIHDGNIGELDYIQKANKIIHNIKQNASNKQRITVTLPEPVQFSNDEYSGFGVHLFPPVVMGPKHKRSIEELICGTFNHRVNNKIFDTKICDNQIIVNKDGFIFVESKNKKNALKILNLIMAFGMFYGFSMHAVREQELVMTNYDNQDLTVTDMEWDSETRRAYLIEDHFNSKPNHFIVKTEINPDTIKEILSNTEKILGVEKLSEDMRLLNEGLTHFANSEFAPAFVMSWSVIEKHYSDHWNTLLHQKNIVNNRLKKLNSIQRSIDSILQILRLLEEIDEKSYARLMKLKNKRNEFYHNGKQVIRNDADSCIKYARKLVDDEINKHISISSNLMVTKAS